MAKCSIVIDLGFGDAGKGLTTDFLASQEPDKSLVVRFSGGHQVGHTVTTESLTHTFSNFSSGTLQGLPTYYSEHTTLFPPAILQEGRFLAAYNPVLYLHPLAMVTTIYDIAYNRAVEKQQQHGSCGLGFGATIARNAEEVCFFANDLQFPWVMQQRLNSINHYYKNKLLHQNPEVTAYYEKELRGYDEAFFVESCQQIQSFYSITTLSTFAQSFEHFIFEGSQGILLDTRHGFFPHTTWSATTSKNAMQLIKDHLDATAVEVYYVTRCYQTRHGNGPMADTPAVHLQNHEKEANVTNEFQGEFRTQALAEHLLEYVLQCDAVYHQDIEVTKNLMLTCLDQLPDFSVPELLKQLPVRFKNVYGSYGPSSKSIQKINAT